MRGIFRTDAYLRDLSLRGRAIRLDDDRRAPEGSKCVGEMGECWSGLCELLPTLASGAPNLRRFASGMRVEGRGETRESTPTSSSEDSESDNKCLHPYVPLLDGDGTSALGCRTGAL